MRLTHLRCGASAALAIAACALGGCSTISSLETASRTQPTYELSPPEAAGAVRGAGPTLFVAEPTASGAITSDRIVVKPGGLQVAYLPDVRWVDPAPVHLQQLLSRSITATGRFGYVGYGTTGPLPDYTLLTDIEAFQAEIVSVGEDGAPAAPVRVVVRTNAALVHERDGRVVAQRRFLGTAGAADESPAAIIAAFEAATAQMLRDTARWVAAIPAVGA